MGEVGAKPHWVIFAVKDLTMKLSIMCDCVQKLLMMYVMPPEPSTHFGNVM